MNGWGFRVEPAALVRLASEFERAADTLASQADAFALSSRPGLLTQMERSDEARQEYLAGIAAGDELAKSNYELFLHEIEEEDPDLYREWQEADQA